MKRLEIIVDQEDHKRVYKLSDGSHLVDDGIPFINKMRQEEIVVPNNNWQNSK